MPHYSPEQICNIALTGQSGAGKTTLVEHLLFQAGLIPDCGTVENGNTVCDFEPQEKNYQHSLMASLASLDHENRHINIIDTPGMPDLMGHAQSVFPAVETVAVVVDAVNGPDVMTRRMLERAERRQLCRVIIINKIDLAKTELVSLVANLKEHFGEECLPLNLPAEGGKQVVDCFFNPEGESDLGSVANWHDQIIDQVVEVDEDLMAVYLEQGQELSPEQLHNPFEKALREGHLIPICFTSAQTGVGVPELLDVLTRLMPNPLEGNPRPFLRGEAEAATAFTAEPDATKHALAHVFKVTSDPFVGKLGIFRVHQGTITKDSQLFIGDARKPFKVGHLFKLQGKTQVEISKAIPGDLCAVAKVDALHFDAVLHDSHDEDFIHLKPLDFPVPLYGLAIHPKRHGDEQKISTILQKLEEEDPCLKVEHRVNLNETVLLGLGELHLRVVIERMQQQFKLEVDTTPPKIAYKESISQAAEGHYRHKKQTGGAGQFGEVFLKIAPRERGSGFSFVNAVTGGAIPSGFIPAVEKGVLQAMENGAVAGYPMQDIEVTVYDGKHHTVDSKEVAFVMAGKKAFLDAVQKAKPMVLEPMVNLEVIIPEADMGAITGALAGKRGRILGSEMRSSNRVEINALVPLNELDHYATELKSATGGHGSYTMEFSHYDPAPNAIQAKLMTDYKPQNEE
ncbi:elongation factor G [Candidatus Venteria ishoeyi]|uniref:Elongation factor G n=1 Tax=Candidatus Venteria ishoeyi TaxID=1899563 RepID=A0A1H6F9T4_9GAMM|nr:elongation factor G [Candidatus Venteria ishoeyi]SEH05765.1 Elongation factor G [Candidatus Venteria ishoeyi]